MQAIKLEMIERNIKAKFLGIHEYYKDETTKDINEENLVDDIKKINPSMVVMVICYSQILHLRFLLEGAGIFSEVRLNRDLCLQSKGQILTMSETQKNFLQTMAQPENIEKKQVVIEGQVGSGKTLLGLEVVKMKVAHYIRLYGLIAKEGKRGDSVVVALWDPQNSRALVDKTWATRGKAKRRGAQQRGRFITIVIITINITRDGLQQGFSQSSTTDPILIPITNNQ